MKTIITQIFFVACFIWIPIAGTAQVTDSTRKDSTKIIVDSAAVTIPDSIAVAPPATDTAVVVAVKDCFQEWYEKFRTRGAKPVTDGKHPVIITLKSEDAAVCLIGQVQVTNGKIVPPLLVQQEDGDYKPFNTVGKKLDPVFASSMTEDQLLTITDGMSILFRTNNQEYGRIIFYTFANKGGKAIKTAPSPDELIKE